MLAVFAYQQIGQSASDQLEKSEALLFLYGNIPFEIRKGDNDPFGIILCATKNEQLVRYATMGLSQKVFVSKYMVNLPSEKELVRLYIKYSQLLLHRKTS